jgi:murein DD-endopeptidase MepM/ murein hydrolase activator NlpD
VEGLLGPLFVLAIVVGGILVVLGGVKLARGAVRLALAPFRACVTVAIGGCLVLLLLGVALRSLVPGAGDSEGAVPVPIPSDPDRPVQFDYPVGDLLPDGRRHGAGWWVAQDFADTVNPPEPRLSGQHWGEDWNLGSGSDDAGQDVYSVADGEVIASGPNPSYGGYVVIRHPLGPGEEHEYVCSLCGHLDPATLVSLGPVRRGEPVGKIGEEGRNGFQRNGKPFPVHLHFEIRTPDFRRHPGNRSNSDAWVGVGYSTDLTGLVNPTSATSAGNTAQAGWIDLRSPP